MRVLLDTDAYSWLKRGEAQIADLVRDSSKIFFSTVVVGELLYGFRLGPRLEANIEELNRFLRHRLVELVPVTFDTADRYSRIAASLRRLGRPIPSNDIWIAAHAMETGAELLSYDDH